MATTAVGLVSYSVLYSYDSATSSAKNISSTLSNSKQNLDVRDNDAIVAIGTTNTTLSTIDGKLTTETITYPNLSGSNTNTGLNVYSIMPKVSMYYVQGTDNSSSVHSILGGSSANGWVYTTFGFGTSNLRSFYGLVSTGTKTVFIEYVDNNGDLITTSSKTLSTTSGTTQLFTNAIGINKVYLDDASSQSINTGSLTISSTSGAASNIHCLFGVSNQYNVSYTCPNGKVAYLKELSYTSQTALGAFAVSNLNVFICSKNGNRRPVRIFNTIQQETFIDLNILIYPGETLFFGCPFVGTGVLRDVNAVVLQYDL